MITTFSDNTQYSTDIYIQITSDMPNLSYENYMHVNSMIIFKT